MSYKYNEISEELNCGGYDFSICDDYHYIKIGATNVSQLKKAGIFPSKNYNGYSKNKPDGLVLKGKNSVKILVEYKKTGKIKDESEAKEILSSWYFKLAKILKCNILCASDGTNYYWFDSNKNIIKNTNGDFIKDSLYIKDITNKTISKEIGSKIVQLIEKFETIDKNAVIFPEKNLNPQNLANKVWQKIWINTGKEPEKCLYNVVEIFIFKFLSDLGILEGTLSFSHIYDLSIENPRLALQSYANPIRTIIKKEKFPPSDIDGTTIFNGTIFVNETGNPNLSQADLFAEVLKEFANYENEYGSFKNIDKQFKTKLYESFLRQSAGISALGQYFTPRNVVVSIINMINPNEISETAKICDPFCGVGGFILELLNQIPKLKENYIPINGKITPKIELIGYDKGTDEKDDERTIILAKANMLIYFADLIKEYKEDVAEYSKSVFNKVFHLLKTNNLGTFAKDIHKDYFDLILTNPPYVTNGVSSVKKAIIDQGLEGMYPAMGNGLEGLALEWIIHSLKPNGQAFIVVPDGVLCRRGDQALRNAILDKCVLNAVISLPTRTFFATPKKTYILALQKKGTSNTQNTPVFTYLVSEIGETRDAKRIEIEENDLVEMSKLYRQFITLPNEFSNKNIRCKIQPIERFKNKNWLVDFDWTDEDKKALGIKDESTEMSEEDFYLTLQDISSSINKILAGETNA